MSYIALDSSVAVAWYVKDEAGNEYAQKVLSSAQHSDFLVPVTFWLEASNVILRCRRQGRIEPDDVGPILQNLRRHPILIDYLALYRADGVIKDLADAHNLQTYDAAYLELAIRRGIPLATLDRKLKDGAKAVKVFYDP